MYIAMSGGIYVFQVVAAAGLRPMERMEKTEKGERVFFVEEKVAKQVVVLEVEVEEVMAAKRLVEVGEGTPGEAEEAMKMIPAEEEEVHLTMEAISKMNAATIQLVMAT